MKFSVKALILSFSTFLLTTSCNQSKPKELEWISFNWQEVTISGRKFEKAVLTIPVTIDDLPHPFNMQLDLGAVTSVFYENALNAYVDQYPKLEAKFDTSLTFVINGQQNNLFKDVNLKLGSIDFGNNNIGYYKGFGDVIPQDSIHTPSEKHIGTIGPDIFQNKVFIIDYPNQQLCVTEEVPKQFSKADFQPFKLKKGRIKIPFSINGKQENLLFDTGSSIFALVTTKKNATKTSNAPVSDSIKVQSWAEYVTLYGMMVTSKIQFGKKELKPTMVYYEEDETTEQFYQRENIWGLTGNAYFFDNVVIIDYKNKHFGIL